MTAGQKWIAVAGLVAIGATLLFAPFDATASSEIWIDRNTETHKGIPIETRHAETSSRLYGPAWTRPEYRGLYDEYRDDPRVIVPDVFGDTEVELALGTLGLWWGGIAACTLVCMVVAAPSKSPA